MRELYSFMWLVIAGAVLTSCSLEGIIAQDKHEVAAKIYKNPHTACMQCHGVQEPKGEEAKFPPGVDPSIICLECHNYRENHHPVNFIPANPWKTSYPLFNGEVRCLTCHEIHGGPWREGSPKLLRGGPYADRRKICFDCHTNEQYAKINPHDMRDNSGTIKDIDGKPVCLLCHAIIPDPYINTESDIRFKADVGFLCWRCHPPMPGTFIDKHFLVTPTYKAIAYMNRPEVQKKFTLPRIPRGRITCSTCHNPHQEGIIVFPPAAAGADSLHKLRDINICDGCHDMGQRQ
jgi:predicted CXXCH cytochrome family protein